MTSFPKLILGSCHYGLHSLMGFFCMCVLVLLVISLQLMTCPLCNVQLALFFKRLIFLVRLCHHMSWCIFSLSLSLSCCDVSLGKLSSVLSILNSAKNEVPRYLYFVTYTFFLIVEHENNCNSHRYAALSTPDIRYLVLWYYLYLTVYWTMGHRHSIFVCYSLLVHHCKCSFAHFTDDVHGDRVSHTEVICQADIIHATGIYSRNGVFS